MAMQVTSPAFSNGDRIPVRHTCDGEDLSPPLAWSGAPPGTKSFALPCDDPDAPAGVWHHWAIFDVPADVSNVDERTPTREMVGGMRQALNDFGRFGYGGPCPPRGDGVHHYHFKLYALDAPVAVVPGLGKDALLSAMQGHIIAQGELVATYQR